MEQIVDGRPVGQPATHEPNPTSAKIAQDGFGPSGECQAQGLTIEFHQQDWIPGFAAFLPDATTPAPNSKAFCVVNVGAFLEAANDADIPASELPYLIAESMMHEVIHVLEQWAGVEFSEDRVEALLATYRDAA